ncbi:MAG: hypothetical protein ACKOTZ_10755 [Chloroflexota bacterium]
MIRPRLVPFVLLGALLVAGCASGGTPTPPPAPDPSAAASPLAASDLRAAAGDIFCIQFEGSDPTCGGQVLEIIKGDPGGSLFPVGEVPGGAAREAADGLARICLVPESETARALRIAPVGAGEAIGLAVPTCVSGRGGDPVDGIRVQGDLAAADGTARCPNCWAFVWTREHILFRTRDADGTVRTTEIDPGAEASVEIDGQALTVVVDLLVDGSVELTLR